MIINYTWVQRAFGLAISAILVVWVFQHHYFFYPVVSLDSVDVQTFKILDACAERNTSFLKGKITQGSVDRFKEYCRKKFAHDDTFHCVLFTYTPGILGGWSVEKLTFGCRKMGVQTTLKWLQRHYRPAFKIQFFYVTNEPYIDGWCMDQKVKDELWDLLDDVPVLISCNHPDLPWTRKAVLVPDEYILHRKFTRRFEEIINDDKKMMPFTERQSKLYFRGGLSGPKVPFSQETLLLNPRHHLLQLISRYEYLDVGITDLYPDFPGYDPEYVKYLVEHYAYLQCSQVDFFEHARHKYLLSFDGFGAAWTRVELIMATGSVLFLNAQCEQYFYHLMENNKTHVVINSDLSNFDSEFKRLEANPELAQKIGQNGREFARQFFTKEAIGVYFVSVLNKLHDCWLAENNH